MDAQKLKAKQAQRRRYRVRKALYGTPERPRLSVFRSNLHISAQLIDDLNGVTLAAATSAGKASAVKHGGNVAAAAEVGKKLAEKAKEKGITQAAFDRGSYRFHGRVAALARLERLELVVAGQRLQRRRVRPGNFKTGGRGEHCGWQKRQTGEMGRCRDGTGRRPGA